MEVGIMPAEKEQRKKDGRKISKRTAIKKDKQSRKLSHEYNETDRLTDPQEACYECKGKDGERILFVCCNERDGITRLVVQNPLMLEGIIEWVHEHEVDENDPMDGPDEDELIVDSGCPG